MRLFWGLWAGLALLLVAAPLVLSSGQRDRADCVDVNDLDRRVSGCTRIIWDVFDTEQDRVLAYLGRAEAYYKKGDNDRAIADITEAIRLNPGNATAYVYRAAALLQKGDADRALADASEAIRLDSGISWGYFNRGRAYAIKRDFDHAIADYTEAIRLNSSNPLAYGGRAAANLYRREFDKVIADASEAIRLYTRNTFAYIARGDAYFDKGDFDRAASDASEAIQLDPKNAVLYSNRAAVYEAKGDYDLAIADAGEAIRLDPNGVAAYFTRGRANLYSGSLSRALADLDQASTLAPRDAYVALWLDIVGQRSNVPTKLPRAISQIDTKAWPAPLIQLFLGQSTPAGALAAADRKDLRQVCEANFYTGEMALRAGVKDVAIRLFRAAASECSPSSVERESANAELKALGDFL